MNIKSILNFFEEHIEKIIFVLAAILSAWFFVRWVIISPNYVEYNGKNFVPGTIDKYIYENSALALNNKLNRPPEPSKRYEPEYNNFVKSLDSPLDNLDPNIYPPRPEPVDEEKIMADREYAVPKIGQVTDAEAEHIRAVAYVPTEEVTVEIPYEKAKHKPDDIDLVTVEGKFDTSKLYINFYETFAGPTVPSEWQDPCAAQPIFAAVDLQRSHLLPNGTWSDWKNVPRPKIDPYKNLFQPIENVENLPSGGMKLRLLQYKPLEIARSLLQPPPYVIASPKEEWFPPHLHAKYNKVREDIEREDRLKAIEQAEKERNDTTNRRGTTTRAGGRRGTGMSTRGRGGAGMSPGGGIGGLFGQGQGGLQRGSRVARGSNTRGSNVYGSGRDARSSRNQAPGRPEEKTAETNETKPKEITIPDIEKELDNLFITTYTKLFKMSEPFVFWAIDDTVQSNQTYRYRMRLGIFNPMAGTGSFIDEYKSYQDQAILWSGFSNQTEAVQIPRRLYFFPLTVQENTSSVDIQVAKYVLGYWHSNRFPTKPGEMIGGIAKPKPLSEDEKAKNVKIPREINYNTGAMLVDIVPVNEWIGTSTLNQQLYNDLLYSDKETEIQRIPVKSRYWSKELLSKYNEINNAEKEPKEPLRDWGDRSILRGRAPGRGKKGERKSLESFLQDILQGSQ